MKIFDFLLEIRKHYILKSVGRKVGARLVLYRGVAKVKWLEGGTPTHAKYIK